MIVSHNCWCDTKNKYGLVKLCRIWPRKEQVIEEIRLLIIIMKKGMIVGMNIFKN